MATPVFDGASEIEIKEMLKLADMTEDGQVSFMMVVLVISSIAR